MDQAARRIGGGPRIPVVMLTGFLGAGKTTALNGPLADPVKSDAIFADGALFVEIAGGRLSSRPLRGAGAPEPRTAFVAILEGLDPLEAQAALRDCERKRPATRIPVRSAPDG